MCPLGSGGEYSKKYVKATQEDMRHTIIPRCADECARKRAELAWSPTQYRSCLKECIRRLIKELAGG